jgi:hypothetical protein
MTWALKRQLVFIFLFLVGVSAFLFWITYPIFNKPPSCVDNRQNGNETGIDCGGSCTTACKDQVDPISILWSRAFRVVPGRYNAVAYIENQNPNLAIKKISYQFRFADKDNIYIGKRDGVTYIPPAGKYAIFEPAIDVGNSIPVYTTFEFKEEQVWSQIPPDRVDQLNVFATDIRLEGEEFSPKLFAKVTNNSLFVIPEVTLVAILYDEEGNAVSTSRTYLDVLQKEESLDVSFTWPELFSKKIVVKEIIPMYDISLVKLK